MDWPTGLPADGEQVVAAAIDPPSRSPVTVRKAFARVRTH